VTVTAAGKQLLQYTEKILTQMETARTLVAPRTTRGKERLRLGVTNRAREFILPVVLPLFQREFPNKLVAIEPANYERNLELLDSGLLDLVVTLRPFDRPELEFVPLFEDELRFMVAPGHPWAKRGRASREDLAGKILLLYLKSNNTPRFVADYFQAEGVTLTHGVELDDHDSIKELITTNLAVGVLSQRLAGKELQNGSLVSVPMGLRPLLRQWGIAYLRKRQLAAMEKSFIELCRLAVPGILSRMQGQPINSLEKKETYVETFVEQVVNMAG
jgi:DNA-binding transcriptional LysR family regulator